MEKQNDTHTKWNMISDNGVNRDNDMMLMNK
jgi:hypothetical protein